jgi:hypothetical protein
MITTPWEWIAMPDFNPPAAAGKPPGTAITATYKMKMIFGIEKKVYK